MQICDSAAGDMNRENGSSEWGEYVNDHNDRLRRSSNRMVYGDELRRKEYVLGVYRRLDVGCDGRPNVQLCHTGDHRCFCDHQLRRRADWHGYAALVGPGRMVCGRAIGSTGARADTTDNNCLVRSLYLSLRLCANLYPA